MLLFGGGPLLAGLLFLLTLRGCGYLPELAYVESSPDGVLTVEVRKRVAFPSNELLDPSIVVSIRILRAGSEEVLSEESFYLLEDSDYQDPRVRWDDGEGNLVVSGFSDREELVLRVPVSKVMPARP